MFLIVFVMYQNCSENPVHFSQIQSQMFTSPSSVASPAEPLTTSQTLTQDCGVRSTQANHISFSCAGNGFIGSICDDMISDGGDSGSNDDIEVYCIDRITRICLTHELCPWRVTPSEDTNSNQEVFKNLDPSKSNCSPFGLRQVDLTSYFLASCSGSTCAFKTMTCTQTGDLKIIK